MDKKRLIIYLLLSFGISWVIFIVYGATGHKWDGTNPYMESLVGMGMLVPFIAHLLTRYITKEGFALTGKDSLMLGMDFKNKKWIFFILAIILPWIYFELGYSLMAAAVPEIFDAGYYKELGLDKVLVAAMPFSAIINGVIGSALALGEEGGWRGYMMPKLINIFGVKKSVFIGGIIWGLWHAPLTVIGHNFGTDYPGYPLAGILFMCVICTFIGIMLTYITMKTGSIWPAAFMHAVNNAHPSVMMYFLNTPKYEELKRPVMMDQAIIFAPMVMMGIICLVLLFRDVKNKKTVV